MTTLNNFTRPPEHEQAIELSYYRDDDLARVWFDADMETLQYRSQRHGFAVFHTNGGTFDPYDISATIKGTVKELKRFLDEQTTYDTKGMKKAELIDHVIDFLDLSTIETLEGAYNYINVAGIFDTATRSYNLQLIPLYDDKPCEIKMYESRGYSQGDYAKVYYVEQGIEGLEKHFDQLLWNQPVYLRVDIDDTEYSYSDLVDFYDYEPEKFIEALKGEGIRKDTLEKIAKMLPEYI